MSPVDAVKGSAAECLGDIPLAGKARLNKRHQGVLFDEVGAAGAKRRQAAPLDTLKNRDPADTEYFGYLNG